MLIFSSKFEAILRGARLPLMNNLYTALYTKTELAISCIYIRI